MDNYATHQRLLLRAALNTQGVIVELGCGWYSTPLLHEVAKFQRRLLLSVDNDPKWCKELERVFGRSWHTFECPMDRSRWTNKNRIGLVFVDHGPTPETPRNSKGLLNALDRAQAVLDLIPRTDVFVLHDTEPAVRWEYDWDKLPDFKYSYTDTSHDVHTTVCSNVVDVRAWT